MSEEYTLKWYNMGNEPGGGSGGGIQPTVHVKLVNGGPAPTHPVTVTITSVIASPLLKNNNLLALSTFETNVSVNEYVTYDLLAIGEKNPFTPDAEAEFKVGPFITLNTDYSGSNQLAFNRVYSDEVNCEVNDNELTIIDPTKEASATVTVYTYEERLD